METKHLRPQDFDITMNLFHYYRDEAIDSLPYIEEEYDENTVIETIRDYAILETHCWLNLYEGQRPVGFVGGYLVNKPWNKNILIAHVQFVYIIDSHRNLDNFRDLLDGFKDWAKQKGAVAMSAGDIGLDTDRMRKLYEHFGFKSELSMIKDITNE
jgi:GNAT superfamily N-acetyltransferase